MSTAAADRRRLPSQVSVCYSEPDEFEDYHHWDQDQLSDDSDPEQGEIPSRTSNGPLVLRPITVALPDSSKSDGSHRSEKQHKNLQHHLQQSQLAMESNRDTRALLQPRMANSLPNGVLNRAFEHGEARPHPDSVSDSSGAENYVRHGYREDGRDHGSDGEYVRIRRVADRNGSSDGVRDSCTSLNSLDSVESRSRWKGWDVFRTYKRQKDDGLDDQTISIFRKIIKVVVGIFLTVLVLATTVVSKGTLLLITSSIYKNATLYCTELPDGREFYECTRVFPDQITGTVYMISQNMQIGWMWALSVVIVTPYLLTFVKCSWRACFKSTRRPTFSAFITVLTAETLNSVGVCLFTFHVLPSLDALRGLVLCVGVAFVPAALKLFDGEKQSGRNCLTYVVDVLAILVQASALLLWTIRDIIFGEVTSLTWAIPVSLFLISCSYWENYINKCTHLGALGAKLRELKKNTRRMRVKIYIFVSLWKIVLTFALMAAINSDLKLECLKVLYFNGDDGVRGCGHLIDPYSQSSWLPVANVEAREFFDDAFWVMLIQVAACLLCYSFAKTACKVLLQVSSFALPLTIATPVLLGAFLIECETRSGSVASYKDHDNVTVPLPSLGTSRLGVPSFLGWTCDVNGQARNYLATLLSGYYMPVAVLWWLSFMWVTAHIWFPSVERLVQTERLFVQPLYCGVFLEQSLILNRRRDDKDREAKTEKKAALQFFQAESDQAKESGFKPRGSLRTDITPMIYVCATLWHETEKEMNQVLKSLFRLDVDQCTRKHAYMFFDVVDPDYYEFEAHFFFDDAFEAHDDEDYEFRANGFVKQFVRVIDRAASAVHRTQIRLDPPVKYPTPYGGRLEWTLPGQNKLAIHLKDKTKVRHKKRWSQVMYMYYLLGHRLVAAKMPDARRKQVIADNTFLLTLDGDVDFQPSAVQLLVDRMKKNDKVGAACGRIHPVGTGPMVWYQKFEYAVSHWLQKATEHMIGCVLCSPGCFSLFRASALMDDNVMRKYATVSSQARDYVQYDQGEDRWLCTLLLQQGYRVEYCAAADALTYAPEGFEEFFNQRRRWSPSTMANIMDLLQSWRTMIKINENMSVLYMAYQLLLFVSSMLTPGTILMLIVGAINTAFPEINLMQSLFMNLAPVIIFLIVCLMARSKVQLAVAGILSIGYALLMMVVIVGLVLEMKKDGICAPTTIFMIFVVGVFVISAIMHPMEFYCLFHGGLYLLSIPAMSMLLMIYSICNLNVVSWGTRETLTPAPSSDVQNRKKAARPASRFQQLINVFMLGRSHGVQAPEEDSDYGFSCGNLFKCLCCPRPVEDKSSLKMAAIMEKLDLLEKSMTGLKKETIGSVAGSVSAGSRLPSLTQETTATAVVTSDLTSEMTQSPLQPNFPEEGDGEALKMSPQLEDPRLHVNANEAEFSPFWLMDDELGPGKVRYLGTEEARFWREAIDRYLFPLENDPARQQKLEQDLVQLRNKMSLMFFLLNALFIVIVSALQYTNAANDGNGLAIPLPCVNDVGKSLTLEPISLLFMATFGIALVIQFFAMFFHRMGTFLHIIASTEVNCMRMNQQEIAAMAVSDKLELVRQMQHFGDDDDDARSDITSTSMETTNDDSSSTTDDSPRMGRRKTVMRLTKKRGRPAEQKQTSLMNKFMERYMKLAKDLRKDSKEPDRSNSRRRNSSRKKRKTQRAMVALENSSEKTSVLLKAQKWQNLNRVRNGNSNTHSVEILQKDPWVSMVKGVMSQSRTSLNTISEEDARSLPKRKFTWANSADSTVMMRRQQQLQDAGQASRPVSRSSFGGRRSTLNILDEVKEAVTPPSMSPTGQYERIEMTDVLQVGKGRDRRGGGGGGRGESDATSLMRDQSDVTTTEPNSETTSLAQDGDSVTSSSFFPVPPPPPLTASTILSADDGGGNRDAGYFTYDIRPPPLPAASSASLPTQAEVHASASSVSSPVLIAGRSSGPDNGSSGTGVSLESPGRLIRATDTQKPVGSDDQKRNSKQANTRF